MFNFGEGHKEYIRRCRFCTFNILEGAVRSGKTVDNVFAFAQELKTTPDKIHLATGSTMGNAKLNIGDANGFGLEWIFRGQCHWGKYKDMEALIINGPYTNFKQKVVIFAGASSSDSFKKIRGNSYGMWIATEINLHHDTAIKEAFNRQLAAKNRKIFWDMNPEHPKAPIYENYLDVYDQKAKDGTLKGGYNYAHFTIFENVNITKERLEEIVSQYDENSIWYVRDILGKRSIAEGLVYTQFASLAAMANNPMKITVAQAQEMIKRNELQGITIGYNIVMGVWNGICNAAGWFRRQVSSFFSGIVDGAKSALGIHSPSKVFADEIGKWIPPGIGVGIEAEMPDLYKQMDDEMASLGKRMQTAVNVETGKIAVDKKVSTTYKVEKEKQGVFESGDTTVEITGETHVHVDLDGREVGDTTTPIVDENMARIDTHKKRGG